MAAMVLSIVFLSQGKVDDVVGVVGSGENAEAAVEAKAIVTKYRRIGSGVSHLCYGAGFWRR